MNSKSDTGHAKNATNFEELGTITGKAGAAYAPSRAELKNAAIMILAGLCSSTIITVEEAESVLQRLSNEREILFGSLRKFITRLLNIVSSSGVTQQTKDDLMHLQKKFQGRRSTPKKDPTPEQLAAGKGKSNSVSQQSYDNLVTHFRKFITLLKAEPLYNPNEDEMKIASLDYLYTQLSTANKYVKGANKDLNKMRAKRQELFYAKDTGMYHIALAVKTYVRGALTPDSEEYKQINSLKFTDLSDRD